MEQHKQRESALEPNDLGRFFLLRANAGDIEGIVALYASDAVLAGMAGQVAIGSEAIRAFYAGLLADRPTFEPGQQRPALRYGDLALTSTLLTDGTVTAEVARRQPDGTWLWAIDQPSIAKETRKRAAMSNRSERNQPIIAEFRANAGKVGGQFADTPLLLLNTTGATSRQPRVNPLAYIADGDRLVVFAANGGRDQHPAWYYNVLAHPLVTVELGDQRFQARVLVAEEPVRTRLYATMVEHNPGFAEFEQHTNRKIPAVILERIGEKE